jgi:hypothetical protein
MTTGRPTGRKAIAPASNVRGGLCVSALLAICIGLGPASARAATPELLSQKAAGLADTISVEWSRSLNPAGDIVDPISGEIEGGYGRTMLAYGMLRANERNPKLNLLGIMQQAVRRSDSVVGAPFNLLGVSEILLHAGSRLQTSVTQELSSSILSDTPFAGRAATPCLNRTRCYYNKTLVHTAALLASLQALPGQSGQGLTSLSSRATAARDALELLNQTIPRVQIPDARLTVGPTRLVGAVLSDPTANPTAYLALSTMMLGRALQFYPAPPAPALLAFQRAVVALLGLAAPDGDISYMGRGQGQVWTFATAAASCALAMRLLTAHSSIVSRCEGLVETELASLAVRREFGGLGLATVPRANWSHGEGVDGYANPIDYNGLSVYALNVAADALAGLADPGTLATPGAVSGSRFLDPLGSGLATTDLRGLWFAVHRQNTNSADSRWGFGLVAMERDSSAGWTNSITPRPLGRASQGPTLILDGHSYEPVGTSLHVSAGRIVVEGGWTSGHTFVRAASFVYVRTPAGVVLRLHARKGDRLVMRDWALPGATSAVSILRPAGGRVATRSFASAGDDLSSQLTGFSHTVNVKHSGVLEVLWRG